MRVYSLLVLIILGANNLLAGNSEIGETKAVSNKEAADKSLAHVPHGMVKIYALPEGNKLVIELDSYSKEDRIVEFFNEEGKSLGIVTIWAYNKKRTFVSTLTEGHYNYHVSDEAGTWKGTLVIIN